MSLIDDKGIDMLISETTAGRPDATIEKQTKQLADYIIETGLKPLPLPAEFFYASLPLCVIDAVFSIGVTYTSTANTVTRFCERQGWTKSLAPDAPRATGEHTISEFLALFDGLTPDQMADDLFGNRQHTSTRSGILKAEAVRQYAEALQANGIEDFGDMTETRLTMIEKQVRRIPGQGSGISFDYFRMLAGNDNLIKPDRMVQRYVAKAANMRPERVTPEFARSVLQNAITKLAERGFAWTPRQLDYAIWTWERTR
ncbi:hypothetical protein [Ruegeria sp. Ofav3-42]|uniref:hypothetical protein n=1 Tax=Ruegeria sp. Ofav3-42 TaxID=2917759 RepID=UPI001EF41726|nr:hypothetical protein [Ruegeria sp. Ofav3-42]MCG7519501.1 hypothetical protein [Ruegeria sp. Ofav3-42]